MALAVADTQREEFYKPPPKKKWLQEYIEQAAPESPALGPASITENLSTEAREFVRLFDNGTDHMINKNLKQLSKEQRKKGKIELSQEVIGGVVQGVLDQFQTFFESGCAQAPTQVFKTEETEETEETEGGEKERLTQLLRPDRNGSQLASRPRQVQPKEGEGEAPFAQHHITPVVQSVISQFLNGSMEEFRGSRKRSHRHCRHKREGAADRSRSVIRYRSREQREEARLEEAGEAVRSGGREEVMPLSLAPIGRNTPSPPPVHDENEALNLSLPKPVAKVTFASRDRCYTIGTTEHPSVKSFQMSQSEAISNSEPASPPRAALRAPSVSPPRLALPLTPLDSRKALPVIRHTSARSSPVQGSLLHITP